ncbi:MAG: metallophosphoesterase [Ignisphaera sp.]
MKVLIISDLHYEKTVFKGVDESKAWGWLLSVVDYHKPDYLLSCGDWGTAINFEEFYILLDRTTVLSIYGNHENIAVLSLLRNTRSRGSKPVLMKDGRVYDLENIKVAGINGVISEKKRSREGVHYKTPYEYIAVAQSLSGIDVDILLIHEAPYIPHVFPSITETISSQVVLKAIEIVKPKLVIGGHMHYEGYKVHQLDFGTLYIHIDSSQASRYYLTIEREYERSRVDVWRDYDVQVSLAYL